MLSFGFFQQDLTIDKLYSVLEEIVHPQDSHVELWRMELVVEATDIKFYANLAEDRDWETSKTQHYNLPFSEI